MTHSPDQNKNNHEKRERFTLRPHQQEAIESVVKTFENPSINRCQLLMACGTGKTLTSLWVKEKLLDIKKPTLTVVFLPSLYLVRQFSQDWESQRRNIYQTQVVCSSSDIKPSNTDQEEDTPTLDEAEIKSMGATISPDQVANFLETVSKNANKPFQKVIFATYHSADVVSQALLATGQTADLVFCDESHNSAGVDKTFGKVHHNAIIPADKRIYMTATPKLVAPNLKLKLEEEERTVFDMSDETIFGPIAYELGFREAIERGILCDYEILVVTVIIDDVIEDLRKKGVTITSNFPSTKEEKAYVQALALAKATSEQDFEGNRIISFHTSIDNSSKFVDQTRLVLGESGFQSDFITGKHNRQERETKMNLLKNNPKAVLANAKVLTEGVDVPAVGSVFFADAMTSLIRIIQAQGRTLRPSPSTGKTKGYVIVPIIATRAELADASMDKSDKGIRVIENLINVVCAIGQEDKLLRQQLLKKSAESTGGQDPKPEPITTPNIRFIGTEGNLESVMEKIELKIIRRAGIESVYTWKIAKLREVLTTNKGPFSETDQLELFEDKNFISFLKYKANNPKALFNPGEREEVLELISQINSPYTKKIALLREVLTTNKGPFSEADQLELFEDKNFISSLKYKANDPNTIFNLGEREEAFELISQINSPYTRKIAKLKEVLATNQGPFTVGDHLKLFGHRDFVHSLKTKAKDPNAQFNPGEREEFLALLSQINSWYTSKIALLRETLVTNKGPFSKADQLELFGRKDFITRLRESANDPKALFNPGEREEVLELISQINSTYTKKIALLKEVLATNQGPFSKADQLELFEYQEFIFRLKKEANNPKALFNPGEREEVLALLSQINSPYTKKIVILKEVLASTQGPLSGADQQELLGHNQSLSYLKTSANNPNTEFNPGEREEALRLLAIIEARK